MHYISLTSNSTEKLYESAFMKTMNLDSLVSDEKLIKETSAILALENYKAEHNCQISSDSFVIDYDYSKYQHDYRDLINLEITHYNYLFFESNTLQDFIDTVKKDPSSKKNVLQFWNHHHREQGDPCVVYIWLRMRNGKLDMNVHMRANNAFRLLLVDIHFMTTIHKYIATKIGAKRGNYIQYVDSLHIYKIDYEKAKLLLKKLHG